MKKHVYMVQVIWSLDEDSGVDTRIFSNYKKAQKSFYNTVNDEIENTWVSDYRTDDKFDDGVEYDTTNYHYKDDEVLYRKWIVQQKYDWSFSTQVTLDIMEVL